eukprot:CAMPEP_0195033458 /NCGR_PEP_ID=MMETSP0326_2-20130528/65632_1 /TAXON_ID=2866 ORGANISM="Crypthecodinium cohnii, Strain Seligo" /NCGR_SAMPLE_ID=MMETSP0326_2 /ASSEMBLY_ACC=CAM_ASM_000348 /LENGTH=197 /DNA_ID=CAMNT_0040057901 /DNA_START=32 /DNA_END=622 /DNA_ORIENTATION=-
MRVNERCRKYEEEATAYHRECDDLRSEIAKEEVEAATSTQLQQQQELDLERQATLLLEERRAARDTRLLCREELHSERSKCRALEARLQAMLQLPPPGTPPIPTDAPPSSELSPPTASAPRVVERGGASPSVPQPSSVFRDKAKTEASTASTPHLVRGARPAMVRQSHSSSRSSSSSDEGPKKLCLRVDISRPPLSA